MEEGAGEVCAADAGHGVAHDLVVRKRARRLSRPVHVAGRDGWGRDASGQGRVRPMGRQQIDETRRRREYADPSGGAL